MMITFSITSPSIVGWSGRYRGRGLGPFAARALLSPAGDRPTQLKVGDRAGQRRQPEGKAAVDQYGDHRLAAVDAERDQGADHAAVHSADPAGQREQVRQPADEKRLP